MRAIVTGTSGFIGSHLAEVLRQAGWEVLGLDKREPGFEVDGVRYVRCDILRREELLAAVSRFAPSAFLHLAARTDLDGSQLGDYAANIEGVANVVAAIQATPSIRRAICTSTQLVFKLGEKPPTDTDYNASTMYGESKIHTEKIWRDTNGGGAVWCIVRPTTIWGPRMNPHYLKFFRMLRSGTYFHVGKGDIRKSYGYVGNTVLQYKRLLEAPDDAIRNKTFYLADYQPISIADWAEQFRIALGGPRIRTVPKPLALALASVGDVLNRVGWSKFPFNTFRLRNVLNPYVLDLSDTRAVSGELPYSMNEGVAATSEWIRGVFAAESAKPK